MNTYLQEIHAQQRLTELYTQAQNYRLTKQTKARPNWRKMFVRPSFTPALR